MPAGVQGCYVPVAVDIGGVVSNITTIAVSATGDTCSDSILGQDLISKLAGGGNVNFGYVRLENTVLGYAGSAFSDDAYATFSAYTPQTAGMAVYGVSSGYCVTATNNGFADLADLSPRQLDAGASLALQGLGNVSLSSIYGGYYYGYLSTNGRYLWSERNYTVSGTGGAQVGAFSATDNTSDPSVQFSNISGTQSIPLSSDLTVKWNGGNAKMQNGLVTIGASSTPSPDAPYQQTVVLQCTAPLSAGSFTIPKWVLSTLPPSGTGQNPYITYPLGWIWIGQYNNPVTFQAQGLDRGILSDVFFNGAGVYFK